jgi:hypothetical protein
MTGFEADPDEVRGASFSTVVEVEWTAATREDVK